MLLAALVESRFTLNVLQKLDRCFTVTNNFFSIVLQGVTDSGNIFIFRDIGACDKQSDGDTYCASTLYHFLEDFESTLPKPASFGRSGTNAFRHPW
jgi:hypothetical protein